MALSLGLVRNLSAAAQPEAFGQRHRKFLVERNGDRTVVFIRQQLISPAHCQPFQAAHEFRNGQLAILRRLPAGPLLYVFEHFSGKAVRRMIRIQLKVEVAVFADNGCKPAGLILP